MSRRWRIKKGDQVFVNAGKNKGKTGEVLDVFRQKERVLVKGVNICKKHEKPSAATSGGIIEKEAPIHVSNVMLLDPKSEKPTRVGVRVVKDGRKVRYSKSSGELIDSE